VKSLLKGVLGCDVSDGAVEAEAAGLIAAALVALSPMQIRYSMEARMYSLGTTMALLSSWALVRALDPDRRGWRSWLVYGSVTICFVYIHNFALLTVCMQALFMGWWLWKRAGSWRTVCQQPAFRPAVMAFAAIAVAFLPWVPILLYQLFSNAEGRSWIPRLTGDAQVTGAIYRMFVDPEVQPEHSGAVWVTALLAVIVLACARRGRAADWFVLALGLGPLILAMMASLAGVQVFLARYFVFSQPFLLAAVAMTLVRIRPLSLAALGTTTAIVASYWVCSDAWLKTDLSNQTGYRGAAEYLGRIRQPGDPVIICRGYVYLPLRYHSVDRNGLSVLQAPPEQWTEGGALLEPHEILSPTALESMGQTRIWVVNQRSRSPGPQDLVPIPSRWREVSRKAFRGVFNVATIDVIEFEAR
jgi:hypothetical protein